jgi:hypothetical protein
VVPVAVRPELTMQEVFNADPRGDRATVFLRPMSSPDPSVGHLDAESFLRWDFADCRRIVKIADGKIDVACSDAALSDGLNVPAGKAGIALIS